MDRLQLLDERHAQLLREIEVLAHSQALAKLNAVDAALLYLSPVYGTQQVLQAPAFAWQGGAAAELPLSMPPWMMLPVNSRLEPVVLLARRICRPLTMKSPC